MVLVAIAVLVAFQIVRAENERVLRAEVAADLATVRATDAVANVVVTLTILRMRADQTTGTSGASAIRYIAIDPQSGERIGGNLPTWPRGVGYGARGSIRLPPMGQSEHGLVGEVTSIESIFPLFIARETRISNTVLYALGASFTLLYATVIGLLLLSQRRRFRRFEVRIRRIQSVMTAFVTGDRRARIADETPDDLGRVAHGLDAMLGQLDERLTGHDIIAERIAHELRSPIAHAAARIAEWPDGHVQKVADEARTVVRSLLDMIDGVLFITDLRHRDLRRSIFRLDELLEDLRLLFLPTATERDIAIICACPPTIVIAERPLIERMFANLIDNAVHYTRAGGQVTIVTGPQDGGILVSIADQGPGTAGLPQRPGAILERGPAGRDRKGTGLGLATAMRIADRHGLRLQMRDRTSTTGLVVDIAFPSVTHHLETLSAMIPESALRCDLHQRGDVQQAEHDHRA